jgi:hypothetical protein
VESQHHVKTESSTMKNIIPLQVNKTVKIKKQNVTIEQVDELFQRLYIHVDDTCTYGVPTKKEKAIVGERLNATYYVETKEVIVNVVIQLQDRVNNILNSI